MAITRETPLGTALEDGFSTKVAFSQDPDISLWEISVTPPGAEGGDAIDVSTMFNSSWRTKAARSLIELTDVTFTAAYDPKVYDQIISIINVVGQITVVFPDSTTLTFYGYLQSFVPGEAAEGGRPEADVTIVCTNRNPGSGAESAPVYA